MKTSSRAKGTIRFAFKNNKEANENKSKDFLIYLFFTYGNRRFKLSTGYKCNYKSWDFKKQKVKNIASIKNKDAINRHLSKLSEYINEVYDETLKNEEEVSSKLLKNRLENKINNTDKKKDIKPKLPLTDYFEKVIHLKSASLSKPSINTYKQSLKSLEEFQKHENKNLEFEDIDLDFYSNYVSFLERHKNYSTSTIAKHVKKLKAVMNRALDEGLTSNIKHKSSEFKATEEKSTQIYLNEDEVKAIANLNLSQNKNLDRARDIFLIGCYSGQRVSDYNNFSKNDIVTIDSVGYIKFIQTKNYKKKRQVHCPLTKEIKHVMAKYNDNFPPKMPEQHINKYIKYIAKMSKINQDIKIEYTKGGKRYKEYVPKYKLIGTHTARRSFATNKYKAGMPVYDIMLFTGHTSEKEFYKYIRIKDEERASHIAKSGFFNL